MRQAGPWQDAKHEATLWIIPYLALLVGLELAVLEDLLIVP